MKKILFVAFAATLLAAGCQKTEIINPVGNPIGFSAGLQKLTKSATADGEVNLQTQNFKVWAFTAYTDETNGVIPGQVYDNISELDVTHDGTSWGTELQYYWPGVEKSLDFFAVSTGKFGTGGPTVSTTGQGDTTTTRTLTVSNYIVDNVEAGDDLMVADFVRQHQTQNQKIVDLKFNHALSKVIFKFKTNADGAEDPIVHVDSLAINNVLVKGNLVASESETPLAADKNSNGTRVGLDLSWERDSSVVDSIFVDFPDSTKLTQTARPFVTKLLMPQSMSDKKLTVYYRITEPKQGATPRAFTIDFDLANATVNSWGVNQAITYTIALSPNTITFNPSVNPWEIVGEDTSMSN